MRRTSCISMKTGPRAHSLERLASHTHLTVKKSPLRSLTRGYPTLRGFEGWEEMVDTARVPALVALLRQGGDFDFVSRPRCHPERGLFFAQSAKNNRSRRISPPLESLPLRKNPITKPKSATAPAWSPPLGLHREKHRGSRHHKSERCLFRICRMPRAPESPP